MKQIVWGITLHTHKMLHVNNRGGTVLLKICSDGRQDLSQPTYYSRPTTGNTTSSQPYELKTVKIGPLVSVGDHNELHYLSKTLNFGQLFTNQVSWSNQTLGVHRCSNRRYQLDSCWRSHHIKCCLLLCEDIVPSSQIHQPPTTQRRTQCSFAAFLLLKNIKQKFSEL